MLDSHEKNKTILILIVGFLLVGIVILITIISLNNNKKSVSDSSDIIDTNSKVPNINLNDVDGIDEINKEILNDYNEVINSGTNSNVSYKYYEDEKILSILITYVMYNTYDEQYYNSFKSYNIDLINKKVLTDEEVLKMYGYSKDDLINALNKKMEKYYREEIEQGYFYEDELSYHGYLSFARNISNLTDDVALHIKDGKLVAYRGFALNSDYEDYTYFKEDAFEFTF